MSPFSKSSPASMMEKQGRPTIYSSLALVIFPALLFLLSSCTGPLNNPGKSKPFRGKWWSYYERGLQFSVDKNWHKAEEDFLKSLKKRAGDIRRARTYGMHFIEYFPARELGISFYNQKKYLLAKEKLKASLQQAESSRAKYYLNETNRALLKKNHTDLSQPTVQIVYPPSHFITSDPELEVKGRARDDQFVEKIWIKKEPLFLELAEGEVDFSKRVNLKRGENDIPIHVQDLAGKNITRHVLVTLDRSGPLLILEKVERKNEKVRLTGTVSDLSPINDLIIGDQTINTKQKKEIPFSLSVKNNNLAPIPFESVDSAGNRIKGLIEIKELLKTELLRKKPIKYAMESHQLSDALYSEITPLGKKGDVTPPFIKLNKEIKSAQSVYSPSFYIEGFVKDRGNVESISINNEPLSKASGMEIHFGHVVDLEEGENKIWIEAMDAHGNVSQKVIIVHRVIPIFQKRSARLRASLIPFWNVGRTNDVFPLFDDLFLGSLFNSERFNMLDRTEGFKALVDELNLNRTRWVKADQALQFGKVMQAELLFTGALVETPASVQISARVLDVETSEVLYATDVYGEEKGLSAFKYLLDGLTLKIVRQFPMVEGRVLSAQKEGIWMNTGREKNVKPNMRFIIFKSHEYIQLLEVKVDTVLKQKARGAIVRSFHKDRPRTGDIAVTR